MATNAGKLYIPVVLGSARRDRESEKAAQFIFGEFAKRSNVATEFVDVREFVTETRTVPSWEAHVGYERWRAIAKRADGFLFVSPEYNHSIPGELKLLIDSAFKEYRRKPMAICGVSDGPIGGARMVEHFRQITVTLDAVPTLSTVYFFAVDTAFTAEGSIIDTAYHARAERCFDDLIWYATTLKAGREKNKE